MSSRPIGLARIALELLVAVTAMVGGMALATGLEGRVPSRLARRNAVRRLRGARADPRRRRGRCGRRGDPGTAVANSRPGFVCDRPGPLGWIVGEIVLVRADNELVSPMEAFYLVVGLAMVGLAALLPKEHHGTAS